MEQVGGLRFSVSYTTRPPRANEEEGRDYHFVTSALFQKMVERGEFLEWAEVLGNSYGTRRPNLEGLNSGGIDLFLDIDTQGAKEVLRQVGQAVSVFILPPSPEVLRERLVCRGLDAPEIIERRLANAKKEIEELFDKLETLSGEHATRGREFEERLGELELKKQPVEPVRVTGSTKYI